MASLVVCLGAARGQAMPLDLSVPLQTQFDAPAPGEEETQERLAFLEQRLEATEFAGDLWYYSWFTVHSVGVVYSSVEAATADHDDDRVVGIVDATKAAIGVGDMLLRPLPARLGADPILAMPGGTPELARARLNAAEDLLERSAMRAGRKYSLRPHLESALLNLVGGGIILALGNWEDAAVSTGLGIAVGELKIWTVPTQPLYDLADYRSRFGIEPGAHQAGWYLVPRTNGLAIAFRF